MNKPLFYIGSSPSMAQKLINPSCPADGVMISVNSLRNRKSNFQFKGNWILDSGAFTEITRYGQYRWDVTQYCSQILRWRTCGNMIAAVSQDYMCEPFVLKKTGLTIPQHQELTIKRYDALLKLIPENIYLMPVIQGYGVSDYVQHLQHYGNRLWPNVWVGVGSLCRRNSNPQELLDIIKTIKVIRPDLKLHGFGIKQTALEHKPIRDALFSCDSMAWSYPRKFGEQRSPIQLAHNYQQKLYTAVSDSVHKRVPRTAGALNGQGRKSKWNNCPTKSIRVPQVFADRLLHLAKEWDENTDVRGYSFQAHEATSNIVND